MHGANAIGWLHEFLTIHGFLLPFIKILPVWSQLRASIKETFVAGGVNKSDNPDPPKEKKTDFSNVMGSLRLGILL